MADSMIRDFVAKQRELLELELQASNLEEQELVSSSKDSKTKNGGEEQGEERASHVLGNLEASEISVGMYGRTMVELVLWSQSAISAANTTSSSPDTEKQRKRSVGPRFLPAHRFTVGDEVEIRPKNAPNSGHKKGNHTVGGVINAVADTFVSVALFQDRSASSKHTKSSKSLSKKSLKDDNRKDDGDDDDNESTDVLSMTPLTLVPKSSIEVHKKLMAALEKLERHGIDHPIAGRVVQAMFVDSTVEYTPSQQELPPNNPQKPEPFNRNLDASQREAIDFALQPERSVALIHGPPGTGKTTTIAELIRQAVQHHNMRVLVTAPSNVAVDNILERLVAAEEATGLPGKANRQRRLRTVRLGHPARIKSSILTHSLEHLVQTSEGTEIVKDVRQELQSFLKVLTNPRARGQDKREAYRQIKSLRKEVRVREEKVVQELITTADVVLATTVGAGSGILDKFKDSMDSADGSSVGGFDLVVIDEAAQALEASCWIPILRGRKVVLAGDHKQLPPTIKSKDRRTVAGLSHTLFERLMKLYSNDEKQISRMLQIQYRMHHNIADWASQAMYNGELLTHQSVRDRTLGQLPQVKEKGHIGDDNEKDGLQDSILVLVDTAGCDMHEMEAASGSRFNEGEAMIVNQHIRKLLELGVEENQIAVITPYNGQVELLRSLLLLDFPKLEVRSVDGFQGGEREAVILSLVRSSERGGKSGIGFLRDDRRQNVAVTRAKRHLAVVCDTDTVSKSSFIASLISWIENNGEYRSAVEYLAESTNDKDYEEDLLSAEFGDIAVSKAIPVASRSVLQQQLPNPATAHPMIPVPEAMRMVMEETARILLKSQKPTPVITVPSSSPNSTLLHCVLAEDIVMKEPGYPDYNASIMDGYAIQVGDAMFTSDKAEQASLKTMWTHRIVNKMYAGDGDRTRRIEENQPSSQLPLPSAVYVTTGAMLPEPYNCVVPIEECIVSEDSKYLRVSASADLKPQTWIRPIGCDIPPGSVVLPKDHVIDPVAVGLLLQAGVETMQVKRRTKVGVLSTGNELIVDSASKSVIKGKIPDVNRPILLSLLSTYGNCCEPVDLGIVRDDSVDGMAKKLQNAFQSCDVIITTGGVSMGELDIVEHVLVNKCGGTLHFGRMHMKPGKPATFVTVSGRDGSRKLIFAMPGNPVSATVCTQLLVKPCLELYFRGLSIASSEVKMETGEAVQQLVEESFVHPEVMAKLMHDITLDKKRPEYHRVQLQPLNDGTYQVISTGVQRSSRLMSLRDAEGLLVLPAAEGNKARAKKGEEYLVLLLNNHLGSSPVQICDSVHLKKKTAPIRVAVVEVVPPGKKKKSFLEDTCANVEVALSGSKSGSAVVASKIVFDGPTNILYPFVAQQCSKDIDFVVVSCCLFKGYFQHNLSVSNMLGKHLSKDASSLALQARQGAAVDDPKAALFEVVVGYIPNGTGTMVVCLPESGVRGALSNVRGLLKHGLNLARGKAHNHHHIPATKVKGHSNSSNMDKEIQASKRKALLDKISAFSESAKAGDELFFSTELTSYDRRLVHEFAEQSGMAHRSEGTDGVDRKIILTCQKETHVGVAANDGQEKFGVKGAARDKVKKCLTENDDNTPVGTNFAVLALEESDSEGEAVATQARNEQMDSRAENLPETNTMLAQLAKERADRELQNLQQSPAPTPTSKLQQKKKGQKLGGSGPKKLAPKKTDEDSNLDDLDDMAFLDAQIDKAQNAHGRQVAGNGKQYKTIVNGILNTRPEPSSKPKNTRASSSLQAKLREAESSRKKKSKKK